MVHCSKSLSRTRKCSKSLSVEITFVTLVICKYPDELSPILRVSCLRVSWDAGDSSCQDLLGIVTSEA